MSVRCIDDRLFHHIPQFDDPDLEVDIGECVDCDCKGKEVKYKIFLEALPANRTWRGTPAGYFGPVPGVGMNEYIYCRVVETKAWEFDAATAARNIMAMLDKGYRARCVPPLEITL